MFGECHGHMFMNGRNYKEAAELHRGGVCKEEIRKRMEAYEKAGITFFREGGDRLGVSTYAAEIAGDYGIDYRTPVFAIHKKGCYGGIVGLPYETEEEFRRLVEKAASEGADFIKIMFSGILDFHQYGVVSGTGLEFSEISRLVSFCHSEGFSVMAHVNTAETVKNAVLAGTDSIEHGFYMTEEVLDLMAGTDTVWIPSIAPVGNLYGYPGFPKESVEKITCRQEKMVKLALEKGVHVGLGSDAGAVTVPHVSGLADEYAFLLKAADGKREVLDPVLSESEAILKRRFRRQA